MYLLIMNTLKLKFMKKFKLETQNYTWIGEQNAAGSWKVENNCNTKGICMDFNTPVNTTFARVMNIVAMFDDKLDTL